MMDRLTIEAAEAAVHPGFPTRTPCSSSSSTDPRRKSTSCSAIVEAVCRDAGASTLEIAQDEPRAHASGRGARRLSPRWAASRPTTTSRTASSRARRLPEVLRRIRELEPRSGPPNRQRLPRRRRQSASAHLLRRDRYPARPSSAEAVASEILSYCIEAGGAITGEHGVGADKKHRCRRCFRRTISTRCSWCGARSIRPGSAIPARYSQPRGSAAKCRARIASIRSSARVSPIDSEVGTSEPSGITEPRAPREPTEPGEPRATRVNRSGGRTRSSSTPTTHAPLVAAKMRWANGEGLTLGWGGPCRCPGRRHLAGPAQRADRALRRRPYGDGCTRGRRWPK